MGIFAYIGTIGKLKFEFSLLESTQFDFYHIKV